MAIDSSNLVNDKFGYSVYAVVCHATPAQIATVERLKLAIGAARAIPTAHVTVKGTFSEIESLRDMKNLVRDVARKSKPFVVQFESPRPRFDASGAEFPVVNTPELTAVHNTLEQVIGPISTDAYGRHGGQSFSPHMTLFSDATPEQVLKARKLTPGITFGRGFPVRSIDLIGRVGQAFGGEWKMIEQFQLGG